LLIWLDFYNVTINNQRPIILITWLLKLNPNFKKKNILKKLKQYYINKIIILFKFKTQIRTPSHGLKLQILLPRESTTPLFISLSHSLTRAQQKKIILTVEKATPFHSLNWLKYPYQAFQSLSSRHVRLCGINALTVGGTRNPSGNPVNNTKTNIPHCHGKIKKKKNKKPQFCSSI